MIKNATLVFIALLFISTSCKKSEDEAIVPQLSTVEITEITETSATSGGVINDDGGSEITAKGVCWSTTPEPKITSDFTKDGPGIANYYSELTNLKQNTSYYVRAYAENSIGVSYGDELTFTTAIYFPNELITVQGGTYQMGGFGDDEQPLHNLTMTGFKMSKYEITNSQYAVFLNLIEANADGSYSGENYIKMSASTQIVYNNGEFTAETGKEDYPVINVSWFGAKAYAEFYGGRLPTEAEWEYAARGGEIGNGFTYSGSNILDIVAWNLNNSGGESHIVGTKADNEIGLHDMSGNIFEWCNDWYDRDYYMNTSFTDPQGPESGIERVVRGGSYGYFTEYCRVMRRAKANPNMTETSIGFRPVFDIEE